MEHCSGEQLPYKCFVCARTFLTETQYKNHKKQHKVLMLRNMRPQLLPCVSLSICDLISCSSLLQRTKDSEAVKHLKQMGLVSAACLIEMVT